MTLPVVPTSHLGYSYQSYQVGVSLDRLLRWGVKYYDNIYVAFESCTVKSAITSLSNLHVGYTPHPQQVLKFFVYALIPDCKELHFFR